MTDAAGHPIDGTVTLFSPFDRIALGLLILVCAWMGIRGWMHENPQYDPWAPLNLSDQPGWATARKLALVRTDLAECRSFLDRSAIMAEPLPPVGQGACERKDREVLAAPAHADIALTPSGAQATCGIDAALAYWLMHGVQPAATAALGSQVKRIEHLGTANCRRIGGGSEGNWSEHATGNAIDIAAFVLQDGRRISVKSAWDADGDEAAFLHMVRDAACQSFATVLSPDYNAAHADHLHLDQATRSGGWSACR